MKIEELQFGDWVKCDGKYFRIDEVCGLVRFHTNEYADVEKLEPIPITAEILEKNGFKEAQNTLYEASYPTYVWAQAGEGPWKYGASVTLSLYKEPIVGVCILTKIEMDSRHNGGINRLHACDIDYVHELQHAFRLFGINKEIKL